MNSAFYDCVKGSIESNSSLKGFEVSLSSSILFEGFQDQIVELDSETLKVGIVLEKTQVQFLIAPLGSGEWFDLSSLAYFLSEGKDDWIFEPQEQPLTCERIDRQLQSLIKIFQKYKEVIIQLFTFDDGYESRINLLRESMNKRWEERRKKLKRKLRFPFF